MTSSSAVRSIAPYAIISLLSFALVYWLATNLWLFVPAQEVIKGFFADFDKYPYQSGSSLSASGINYNTIKVQELLKKLQNAQPSRN